ncbi:hypothetical protein Bca4012_011639 [Brassica carinata]
MNQQENHDGNQISTPAASDLKLLTLLTTLTTLSLTTPLLLHLLPSLVVPSPPCRQSSILTFLFPLPLRMSYFSLLSF